MCLCRTQSAPERGEPAYPAKWPAKGDLGCLLAIMPTEYGSTRVGRGTLSNPVAPMVVVNGWVPLFWRLPCQFPWAIWEVFAAVVIGLRAGWLSHVRRSAENHPVRPGYCLEPPKPKAFRRLFG